MTDTIIDRTDNSGAPSLSRLHRDRDGNEDSHTCRFVHPERGHRCGSPALRNEPFCYHHNQERPRPANPAERKWRRNTFELAAPESRIAIQDALGSIFLRIAENEIDLRRAGLLLYTLQIASANLTAAQKEQNEQSQSNQPSEQHPTNRTAIQQALSKLFPRIDDQQLEPRRAGLLLYCLQIASANLKAQLTKPPQAGTFPGATPDHQRAISNSSDTASDMENPHNLKSVILSEAIHNVNRGVEGPAFVSPQNELQSNIFAAPSPSGALRVAGTSQNDPLLHASQHEELESQTTEPSAIAKAPIKGRPISRSTFAALLEALARRQGIDVEKLQQAHDATILLRLHAVAEGSQNASAPHMARLHRGMGGAQDARVPHPYRGLHRDKDGTRMQI